MSANAIRIWCAAIFATVGLSAVNQCNAWEFDPLFAQRSVLPTPAASMPGDVALRICVFESIPNPLPLQEAVERALCINPKTREAWANVKIAAADVGVARGAYLPTISADWQGVRDDTNTDVIGHPEFSSNYRNSVLRTESVSLNWVLYDFGGRSAALANANALLAAAKANQEAVLQTAFAGVAKDYYAAQAAQGTYLASQEIEQTALTSFKAATARANRGIASISDELQAQTSWAEAVTSRTKALGDWQSAVGSLASDMGLDASMPLSLPPVGDGVKPGAEFTESVDELIREAKRTHPSVRAAQAQLEAASEKTKQTRAAGLPTLSLVSKYSWNNQPTTLEVGTPQFPASGREWYIGFQIAIPIFEGFTRTYQIHDTEARTELQRYTLNEVEQQVGLDVWTSYQTLKTATDNLDNTAMLLDIAQRSYDAAQGRYQVGVGSIVELLNAQSSLAAAKRQRIQSLTDWRSARLQLASKLGTLGISDIAEGNSVAGK
ncbi:TolC family protein [Paraburkholderia sp. ZP32-5]|uniref:TolC family protein n=1 Tax=Paraburkholderia sp. ZP32-5 TaxID=2883245 RepID=UPI001F3087F8|nr:TolC family protein [Paraburkholderia sp. ZP32-5]